jgi:predicted transcriptional regulator YheO
LHRFCDRDDAPGIAETFSDDIHEILETMIAESAYEVGRPISAMTKDDRVALVSMLDEMGAFQIKKAVAFVAKRLGVSRYTVYNYLNEARVA